MGDISVHDGAFWYDQRPVYFVGLQAGHFKLSEGLGFSFTGHTTGPKWQMPSEEKVADTGSGLATRAENATKQEFFFDILYSGYAFPAWVTQKHPELKVRLGFMNHDPMSPEGWKIH